ncbi:hypothetical protein ACF0H5_017161 [Mactra antiquata]
MSDKIPVTRIPTHVPELDEVANVLTEGLKKNFANVSVAVVDCPDLTQPPFYLSSEGICGNPRLADIGGPPYLIPNAQRDKIFKFKDIAELCGLPNAFMIGAGAGPAHIVGVNSELMNNIKYAADGKVTNNAWVSKLDSQTGECILQKLNAEEFCLMGNFLLCDGKPGKVIEVKASKRTGDDDFMRSLKLSLRAKYGEQPVGLGGVFLVEKGKIYTHIMDDFSKTPLTSQEMVDNWLKFFTMDPTFICVGELVSHDPGYDLRDEHFHGFNMNGQGGHYHNDTTPDEVEYRGYFVIPDGIYRVDQPEKPLKF